MGSKKDISKYFVKSIQLLKVAGNHAMMTAMMLSMVVGGHSPHLARANPVASPSKALNFDVNEIRKGLVEKLAENDPRLEELMKTPKLPLPDFSAFENERDANPFFMRGQEWSQCDGRRDTAEFSEDVVVVPEGSDTSTLIIKDHDLCLSLPLRAQFLTSNEEFVLFSSPLTKEGFFFINAAELSLAGAEKNPVAVHYMPLPEGKFAYSSYIPEMDAFLLGDENATAQLSVFSADLRDVAKWQNINLMLASVVNESENAARVRTIFTNFAPTTEGTPVVPNPVLLPKPYSTINFGSTFLPDAGVKVSLLESASRKILEQIIPSAHAIGPDGYQELFERLMTFGWIFGTIYVGSVVLKYTLLKNRIQEIRDFRADQRALLEREHLLEEAGKSDRKWPAFEFLKERFVDAKKEAQTTKDPSRIFTLGAKARDNTVAGYKFVKREFVETVDVFAASLTFVGQSLIHLTANSIENFSDRIAPLKLSQKDSKLRRFMNWTFNFQREITSRTPVNARTFFLGAIVMGSVDSAMVFVQMAMFIPWMCLTAVPVLHEFLASRVMHAFDPGNAATKSLIVNDTVRNLIAWIAQGAAGYSQEIKMQTLDNVKKRVKDTMIREGLDPTDSKNAKEYERRVELIVDAELQRMGLPSEKEFIYDFTTLDAYAKRLSGHSSTALGEATETDGNKELIGERRPGLVWGALKESLNEAKRRQNEIGGYEDVIALYENSMREVNALRGLVTLSPIQTAKAGRKLARILTVLSLPLETAKKSAIIVPELWEGKYGETAAAKAAWLFQRTIYSLESSKPYLRKLPFEAEEKFSAEARRLLVEEGVTRADPLYGIKLESEITRLYEIHLAEVEAANYTPPKQDVHAFKLWKLKYNVKTLESRQHERASQKAASRLLYEGHEVNSAEYRDLYRRYYAENLAREVAIYPVAESDFNEAMHAEAKKNTIGYFRETPGAWDHLKKLRGAQRAQAIGEVYGEQYLTAYNERSHDGKYTPAYAKSQAGSAGDLSEAAHLQERVLSPLSPEQPGRFQRTRQKEWVRKSAFLTRSVRLAESFFGDEIGYKTGLKARLVRSVPGYYDLVYKGLTLNAKIYIPGITTTYLFSTYVWRVEIPWSVWAFSYMTVFLIKGPSLWLQRAFRTQNIQPMGGVIVKTLYSIPYAWITFAGGIATLTFAADAKRIGEQGAEHIGRVVSHGLEYCQHLIQALPF
ncbi:MAG TPA: hypothetical protein VM901_10570 [Bdellovibrionota bacterium]|jgi:hypothetical protein|nr:hypothetical protein [Bdellovibrionota bacterium]